MADPVFARQHRCLVSVLLDFLAGMSSISAKAEKCNCVLGLSGCGEYLETTAENAWLDSQLHVAGYTAPDPVYPSNGDVNWLAIA